MSVTKQQFDAAHAVLSENGNQITGKSDAACTVLQWFCEHAKPEAKGRDVLTEIESAAYRYQLTPDNLRNYGKVGFLRDCVTQVRSLPAMGQYKLAKLVAWSNTAGFAWKNKEDQDVLVQFCESAHDVADCTSLANDLHPAQSRGKKEESTVPAPEPAMVEYPADSALAAHIVESAVRAAKEPMVALAFALKSLAADFAILPPALATSNPPAIAAAINELPKAAALDVFRACVNRIGEEEIIELLSAAAATAE